LLGLFLLFLAALLEVCHREDAGKVVRVKMRVCVHVCVENGWMHSCMCFPTHVCCMQIHARVVNVRTVYVALSSIDTVRYAWWV